VKKAIGFYPCPDIDTTGTQVVSHAGTVLLTERFHPPGVGMANDLPARHRRLLRSVRVPECGKGR
jgi:hypothetical protein